VDVLRQRESVWWCKHHAFFSYQFVPSPLNQQTESNLLTTIVLEVHAKISGKLTASTLSAEGI
jgi:hypothetical protein